MEANFTSCSWKMWLAVMRSSLRCLVNEYFLGTRYSEDAGAECYLSKVPGLETPTRGQQGCLFQSSFDAPNTLYTISGTYSNPPNNTDVLPSEFTT
jgi:hypothetical protein